MTAPARWQEPFRPELQAKQYFAVVRGGARPLRRVHDQERAGHRVCRPGQAGRERPDIRQDAIHGEGHLMGRRPSPPRTVSPPGNRNGPTPGGFHERPPGAARSPANRRGGPPMTIDPDRPCPHKDFAAEVDVNRIGDGEHGHQDKIIGYSADIRVRCADCGEPFRWIGVPAGMHPRHPACSPDETELRAPIRPASSDPDFGMGLPGFAIRMAPPDDSSETP